ncbi:hypothetical protein K1W69_24625 [Hoeflea sp. WL0058]|uniref:MT-A70 family protein n=1 Tax=Flavimaribacter sediminis TaxID=2865987 RepID=A0AAE3D264_9HYPH|nr:MT-A70 family methyltransferase [Flavimaribacter sediminis]MBW8640400.1 hypothetical protein [Flavimaribacter sediminis]
MIPFHPIANLFPLIEGNAFDDLVADVGDNGLRELIVIHEGQILDGRNRYRAMVASGQMNSETGAYSSKSVLNEGFRWFGSKPEDGDDPLKWVLSKNLHRRHLSQSQRAMVAAKLVNMPHGGDRSKQHRANLHDAPEAAQMMDVSERSIKTAKKVLRDGAEELQAAVDQRTVTVSLAAQLAALPIDEQREIVALADPRAIKAAAKKWRVADQQAKKDRRTAREADLANGQAALPEKNYGIIYADPEWRFEPYDQESGMDRAADNHYPTSDLQTLMRRDIGALAADDCILFLWATVPMLIEAICCLDAWGFASIDRDGATGFLTPDKRRSRYVSHFAWDKGRIITGYWNRGKHEVLLIATRGNPVAPAQGDQLASCFTAKSPRHSAKPDIVLDWIDEQWPNTPRIELNRRGKPRKGWDAWGNEVEIDTS